jgi:hypothetical protein
MRNCRKIAIPLTSSSILRSCKRLITLIPGGIAYSIAGREKVRNGNRFALRFILLSVFFLLLEVFQPKH